MIFFPIGLIFIDIDFTMDGFSGIHVIIKII
jgi:hypothetical protein